MSTATETALPLLTIADVTRLYPGVSQYHVRRVIELRMVPMPQTLGHYRMFRRADLPVIEQALRDAGYLTD
jgi:hypothetical protein